MEIYYISILPDTDFSLVPESANDKVLTFQFENLAMNLTIRYFQPSICDILAPEDKKKGIIIDHIP